MKVSFDFDSTLQRPEVQKIALAFLEAGNEVWIVTSRSQHKTANVDLFEVAMKLGIPKDRIIFTEYQDKAGFLIDFVIHFDDDPYEIDMILHEGIKCLGAYLPIKVQPNYKLP